MITTEQAQELLKPFPESSIQQVNKKGTNLSYISHPTLIKRIIEIDPSFTMEVVKDGAGNPLIYRCPNSDTPTGMLIAITINGVRREGFGSYDPPLKGETKLKLQTGEIKWSDLMDPDAYKKLFSDAISVAASRFGVGIQLWDKSDDIKTLEQYTEQQEEDTKNDLIKEITTIAMKDSTKADEIKAATGGRKLRDCTLEEIKKILALVK